MALKNTTRCIICDESLAYLWTGNRRDFPDYFCQKCFGAWIIDPETGEPIPDRELPEWIKLLIRQEKTRRVRTIYWRKRGYEFLPIPLTTLRETTTIRENYRSEAEQLEALGTAINRQEDYT